MQVHFIFTVLPIFAILCYVIPKTWKLSPLPWPSVCGRRIWEKGDDDYQIWPKLIWYHDYKMYNVWLILDQANLIIKGWCIIFRNTICHVCPSGRSIPALLYLLAQNFFKFCNVAVLILTIFAGNTLQFVHRGWRHNSVLGPLRFGDSGLCSGRHHSICPVV